MADTNVLIAELRDDVGKGASRRLRRQGKIPAVLYGGRKDPVTLSLEHDPLVHAAQNESFFSSILEIKVADGRRQKVVVRDMHHHPFKHQIMHLDFMRVSAKEVLRIHVPIHFDGEEESPAGKTSGVVIQHQVTEVEIAALPENLPEYLTVDLSALDAGDAVMLSDIVLPKGIEIPALAGDDPNDVIVANAIHIRESQGTGVAAAEEAAAAEAELGLEAEAEGEEELAEGEDADEADSDEADDGDADKE